MTGRSMRARRVLVALVVAVLGLCLAACGGSSDGSSDGPSAGATSTASATSADGYPFETSDEGDDLLSPDRRSYQFGPDAPISWQLPTFYANGEADETSTSFESDGVLYSIQVVAGTGTTPRARAEKAAAQLKAGDEAIHDVRLGGRDWVAVVEGSDDFTNVVLYGSLPGGVVAGAGFTADVPLAKVPPERIAELHQTLLSIQPEPAAG